MTAMSYSIPKAGRWSGAVRLLRKARELGGRLLSPARPVLKNLSQIPLTVAAIGCVAAGVFIASTVAGFILLGVMLFVLEHMIADE